MAKSLIQLSLLALAVAAAGCSVNIRSPEQYRDDTQALLETRNAAIKTCYDDALKTKTDLTGRVTVHFMVEKKTGKITNPAAVPAGTTAPEALTTCVVNSINGLVLTPPDDNDGDATFVYDFTSQAATPAPAG